MNHNPDQNGQRQRVKDRGGQTETFILGCDLKGSWKVGNNKTAQNPYKANDQGRKHRGYQSFDNRVLDSLGISGAVQDNDAGYGGDENKDEEGAGGNVERAVCNQTLAEFGVCHRTIEEERYVSCETPGDFDQEKERK